MSHRIRRVQQLRTPPAPLVGQFGLFAERLEVRTNDPRILAAAEASFGRFEVPAAGEALVLRLVVDGPTVGGSDGPPGRLDARSLGHQTAGHLLSIVLGGAGQAVVDVASGFAAATLHPALVAEPGLLRYAFIEAMAQAMLTGGRGYVPIHASCVVRGGAASTSGAGGVGEDRRAGEAHGIGEARRAGEARGVGAILQGPAGTGKSTLALACARRGWGVLAEDVVFARPVDGPGGDGPLELWGMPWTQRLLPDAPRFFPELAESATRLHVNGEHKLELDLDEHSPGAATPRAAAGPVVLLTRDSGGPTRAEWLSPGDAPADVEVLWPWEGGWTAAHDRVAARLLDRGVLRLHLNSTPDEAVDALEAAFATAALR